jgi:hypothetical protein
VDWLAAALGKLPHTDVEGLLKANGDDDPGEESSEEGADLLGVPHAERDTSGLLDAERRIELVPGVLGLDVLGLIGGKLFESILFITTDDGGWDAIALMLSGLILNPASVGSGRNRGEIWTLLFDIEGDVRGTERPAWYDEPGEERVEEEGILTPPCTARTSPKSTSNMPSSIGTVAEALLRACSSSRLSMSTYSSASISSKPRSSRVDRCSFSRPYARLT